MDGFAVARAVRAAQNYTPVLMLTARGRPEDVFEGLLPERMIIYPTLRVVDSSGSPEWIASSLPLASPAGNRAGVADIG